MDTSNVRDTVSSHYATNMAIFLSMHIEWTTHHFRSYMTYQKMVLLSTSKEMVIVQTTQVKTVSSYAMEIYQQKFVLLVLYIILQADPTLI